MRFCLAALCLFVPLIASSAPTHLCESDAEGLLHCEAVSMTYAVAQFAKISPSLWGSVQVNPGRDPYCQKSWVLDVDPNNPEDQRYVSEIVRIHGWDVKRDGGRVRSMTCAPGAAIKALRRQTLIGQVTKLEDIRPHQCRYLGADTTNLVCRDVTIMELWDSLRAASPDWDQVWMAAVHDDSCTAVFPFLEFQIADTAAIRKSILSAGWEFTKTPMATTRAGEFEEVEVIRCPAMAGSYAHP